MPIPTLGKFPVYFILSLLILNFYSCGCNLGDDGSPGPLYVQFELYYPADSAGIEYHILEAFPLDSLSMFRSDNIARATFEVDGTKFIAYPDSGNGISVDDLELRTIFLHMPQNDIDTLELFIFHPEPSKCGHIYSEVEKVKYNGKEYLEREGISGSFKLYKE